MASIIIKDSANNKEYRLEYNRNALVRMEEWGFNPKDCEKKPLSSMNHLIYGAFIMHHADLSRDKIDEIVSRLGDMVELYKALTELYGNALNSIIAVKKSSEPKNITWGKA